jgi:hypothetical protein
MMKSSMSLAVLLLVENVSASEVYKHHQRPHYQSIAQNGAGVSNKLREAIFRNNMYPETKSFAQRPHHHRHHNSMVQLSDHENDTDDVLDESTYLKFEHENDTETIPDDLEPFNQELLYTKI